MGDLSSFFVEENLDKPCMDHVDDNINLSVPWYLMASYAYYVEDDPILSDAVFDRLAKRMQENWDNIEHQHKEHISEDDLRGGTFLGEYPSRVAGGLKEVRKIYGKQAKGTNH